MMKQYETVIGLEVHVELATKTKIFCGCSTEFGGAPNTHTCPVCTGMPGSLPVLNKKVVEFALKAGLAANCQINQYCKFDRKNYFYPDNPQNYQISQLYLPICHDGWVEIETSAGKKKIRIHEMHMEEDAGKLIHDEWEDCSLVDYNRSGVPLIEIVSEPDMRSSEEVIAYLEKLRCMMQYLGVSDCKLQEGSMRADVNLSVREVGAEEFGTRTEMKNLNSFKAIARAIEGERERQIELIEEGKTVTQETRRWDDNKEYSYAMRSKEDAKDYRYFPDPDLPPIHISDAWIEKIKAEQPELREAKQARYQEEYGLPAYDAGILTESRHLAGLFEETAAIYGNAKKTANWFMGEVLRLTKDKAMDPEQVSFSPKHLADLLVMVEKSEVSPQNAKKVFEKVFAEDIDPVAYIEEHGLKIVEDTGLLEETINRILDANPGPLSELLGGKDKVMGFFVGQIMKEMKGKANPASARETLMKEVEKRK
ncbi:MULTISPECIES: Asp-tRNA(Asn)/Glu-tRNA(Gln) amidotransferase subunit GatB [Blautia]|uniref:Asp-tRNA(Asn)/Glu-tRNA(Gln) amidotransferase subunit GatB n=1 Tax=Blautia TaxID=572511 RepID=UPI0023307839|nr:Asp-tRNA(Asn)/Glu-tRNA(Gln) amidotransferase subunit GatB [Blautia wexlerae]MDB6459657.1 Asp-tRNA(Asn)/Glu-tRNA(Gln) amidotransferase subunit GatB [Blautia wexlerae]MDB6462878.1 Asp-tRNA(Asn)/Glu-tRNA(Gln) amidotransferase subunit GatB [Blautia wexlerae]MDB6466232.1 Asp-tRNA(Asn)/Glu-tRNA(Gln) amidotransferase subunit GatB [Blautia wexlerae]